MLSVKRIIAIALTALLGTSALAAVKNHKLTSPDGRISVVVTSGNGLSWSVSMDGKQLLAPSAVSVTIDDGSVYGEGKLKRAETRSVSRESALPSTRNLSLRTSTMNLRSPSPTAG